MPVVPVARVASSAHWTNWFGTELTSPGMAMTGYSLPTGDVVDGELLVVIACIDNGSDTLWPDPIGPGFTQLFQKNWGNDGQTCAVATKIAASEPASYTGTYGPGIISGSAVIALLAIDNASGITAQEFTTGSGGGINPVVATSAGVTTTVPDSLVLHVTGADWQCYEVTDVTFTLPTGFSQLFLLTDRGSLITKDWTTMQIATQLQSAPGPTGTIMTTETSTGTAACVGTPWSAVLAVAPR
jgi:hypothetical protein